MRSFICDTYRLLLNIQKIMDLGWGSVNIRGGFCIRGEGITKNPCPLGLQQG